MIRFLLASTFLISAAGAATITFSGDSTGHPTFTRPVANLSGLSAAVPPRFAVQGFSVDTAGSYTLNLSAAFEEFLFLYQGSFDPANALTNAIGGAGSVTGTPDPSFTSSLSTGTQYFAVMTGADENRFGAFTTQISGPGGIALDGHTPFSGDITGAPTFTRPTADLTGLSAATPPHYRATSFQVTVSGIYAFYMAGAFEEFMFLYQDSFDPNNALSNAIAGSGRVDGDPNPFFLRPLTAGRDYILVNSGADSNRQGLFDVDISGPGGIQFAAAGTAVPEPSAALLTGAAGAVLFWLRARRKHASR